MKNAILLLALFCLSLPLVGQTKQDNLSLEYRHLDSLIKASINLKDVKDSSAYYNFAFKIVLEKDGYVVKSSDPISHLICPGLDKAMSKQVNFKKIHSTYRIKELIIPFIVRVVGTNDDQAQMISVDEALKNQDKLFFRAGKESIYQSLVLPPFYVITDKAIYQ